MASAEHAAATGSEERVHEQDGQRIGVAGAAVERRSPAGGVALGIVVAALVALVYWRVFPTLWRTWMHSPNYSHGHLIPPISAFLLWHARRRFVDAAGPGTAWGILLVALALIAHVVSIRAGIFMTQGYSLVLLLFGLSLILFGGRATRAVWFPLGYLIFMLPMPAILSNVLSFRLKEFAADVGSAVAVRMGIPLARSGLTIHVASGSLRIADPCSGLRSLIALVALGALFAYLTRGPVWKRLLLFAAAVPLAVLGNIARIASLCAVAHVWSVETALGYFHDVSGVLLFLFAFIGLVVVRKLLRCETGEEAPA